MPPRAKQSPAPKKNPAPKKAPTPKKAAAPQTNQQRLAAVIKSARNIMRVDSGLNGDLDRIPQLAWLLFLKAFDDLEEQRLALDGAYRPTIPKDLRWKRWAGNATLTGQELVVFVNLTLLPGLRSLTGGGTARTRADTLRNVFEGLDNRMRSGAQLRLLINELDKIHFTSSDDIHTMAFLYESMLREMRDAAGDSGEFYTPRPLIRFMVERVAPKLGETILDPAVGTAGFLVEALTQLERSADSTGKKRKLQQNLQGVEKKPLPYLLGTMNLLLHGVDEPNVTMGNALVALRESRQKVDVVLTNPPFGGVEGRDVIDRFPAGERVAETAWLFLVTIIDKLAKGGRCAVVVPNSVLFDTSVSVAGIKKKLLDSCNLHTVVRLPEGVFAPYTPIPSNVLFFDKTGKTETVWFYEVTPPEGQKRYTKTKPMRSEEFEAAAAWWGGTERSGRVQTDRAWSVPAATIKESGYNLDLRNPHRADDLAHRPPAELVAEMIVTEREILGLLEDLEHTVAEGWA